MHDPQIYHFNLQDPIRLQEGLNLYRYDCNSIIWINTFRLNLFLDRALILLAENIAIKEAT